MRACPSQAFERCSKRPKCRAAIVASQDADVVSHAWKYLIQAPRRAFADIHM